MDPTKLVGPANPLGSPAPFWFIEFFKVLGFLLHMIPMSLWYAGIIIAMLLYWKGNEHGKHLSKRLMKQMPIIIAYGINLGIVPLLFTQVAYYKFFYPATILMGWFWFSIFILLIFAYYGVYIYAAGLRDATKAIGTIQKIAGWVSSILFIIIGFLFANNFSLMTNAGSWGSIWHRTSVSGAPLGIALNVTDPTFGHRWLMMFGLAIMTTSAYIIFDSWFLEKNKDPEYLSYAINYSLLLYAFGSAWYAWMGYNYFFLKLSKETRIVMLEHPAILLTALTALSPVLPLVLLVVARRKGLTRTLAIFIALGQFLVLAFNAISRQIVQNAELKKYFDVSTEPVNLQLSPMIVFLLLFIIGLAIIIWMLHKISYSSSSPPS